MTIQSELEKMYDDDQRCRSEYLAIVGEHGPLSEKAKEFGKAIFVADGIRLGRLIEICNATGWPKISEVGDKAASGAFVILQHGDHTTRKRYLETFENTVNIGEAKMEYLALLKDRVLVGDGLNQQYGTQYIRGDNGTLVLAPIADLENVNRRRESMGLGPL